MRRVLRVLVVGAFAALLGIGGWFFFAAYGDRSLPRESTRVEIPMGSDFAQVSTLLVRAGVLAHPLALRILARWRGVENGVRAGSYHVPAHRSTAQVLDTLLLGGEPLAVWVTIPEGFTAKQIARRLQQDGVGDARGFERAFRDRTLVLDGTKTVGLEGYLFPDTYQIAIGASPASVAHLLTARFLAELPGNAARAAKHLHMTLPQIVTIASMIEREAKINAERPIIASVYYNRLARGMPLQVDATIEYALPHHATALTFADLKIDSPYNSYLHAGLPPTPIANPGLASLLAALHPAKTEYLYYVYKGNGHHAFARTLAEHNANVARYER